MQHEALVRGTTTSSMLYAVPEVPNAAKYEKRRGSNIHPQYM